MTSQTASHRTPASFAQLLAALQTKQSIWILTGAGISAPSGIPTYRNDNGEWQAAKPIQHGEFIRDERYRQRYWARSMVGWKLSDRAQANAAHHAITTLQQTGRVRQIVTQNVDSLHTQAGAEDVIDLHGRLRDIVCLNCGTISRRADYQPRLVANNPALDAYTARMLPDGDADVDDFDMSQIRIPPCKKCGGVLMPDVVFFGGVVPKQRVQKAFETLAQADCVLVIGSSLTVFSGFRFIRWAHQNNLPLYAINQGEMRGEDWFTLHITEPCERVLPQLAAALA